MSKASSDISGARSGPAVAESGRARMAAIPAAAVRADRPLAFQAPDRRGKPDPSSPLFGCRWIAAYLAVLFQYLLLDFVKLLQAFDMRGGIDEVEPGSIFHRMRNRRIGHGPLESL